MAWPDPDPTQPSERAPSQRLLPHGTPADAVPCLGRCPSPPIALCSLHLVSCNLNPVFGSWVTVCLTPQQLLASDYPLCVCGWEDDPYPSLPSDPFWTHACYAHPPPPPPTHHASSKTLRVYVIPLALIKSVPIALPGAGSMCRRKGSNALSPRRPPHCCWPAKDQTPSEPCTPIQVTHPPSFPTPSSSSWPAATEHC